MAGETSITVIGNLTADPELRYTPSGAAVASFTIVSTPRQYDRNEGGWRDGSPMFLRAVAWRQLGENVAETFSRGSRVIAQGNLEQKSYENKEGEKRTYMELNVQAIGAELRFATAKINKVTRESGAYADSAPANFDGDGSAPPF